MQLKELIRRFRVQANDKVEPYFNEDEDVIAWLNDAVKEACIRGRLLCESQNSDVCKIKVNAGRSNYDLHNSLYELTRIWFEPADGKTGSFISITSTENLDRTYYRDWKSMSEFPRFLIQDDTTIRLVPCPNIDGELQLEGYRVPLVDLDCLDDEPEINNLHHVHLIQWALAQAFSVPDAEFFDANRAAMAEQAFTDYFGQRPDSDLRRITREDVPHHVIPFMP